MHINAFCIGALLWIFQRQSTMRLLAAHNIRGSRIFDARAGRNSPTESTGKSTLLLVNYQALSFLVSATAVRRKEHIEPDPQHDELIELQELGVEFVYFQLE